MSSGTTQPAKPESTLRKIEDFFHHAEQTAEADFLAAWHEFAPIAENLLKTELGQIAKVAVSNAEALDTDSEKADTASAAIVAAAKSAGITVKDSLVNLLREIALQGLQGTLAKPATPATAGPAPAAPVGSGG
jgi:hypothetical protein